MNRNELKFWGCFLLLNFLLFVPRYIFEISSSTFFPYRFFSQDDIFYTFKYFFNRENYDFFRFSIDFSLLIFLFILFKRKISLTFATLFLSVFYITILIYQAYSGSFEAIYNVEPFFYTDISSLKTGFKIATEGNNFMLAVYLLFVGLAIFGIYKIIKFFLILIKSTKLSRISKVLGLLLVVLMLYSHIRYGGQQVSSMEFINISYEVVSNVAGSIQTEKEIRNIDLSELKQNYKFEKLNLHTSPNVYIIFIESYGKIIYTNNNLRNDYVTHISKLDSLLIKNNIYSASVLSESPVSGGNSWVSYASVLYGINFLDTRTFDVLTDKKELEDAVSLVQLLKHSGYKNYRLTSIKPHNNLEIPWEKYSKIYSVDQWIRYEDLNYKGKLYGFGPSPPDEYSLNFAFDAIQKNNSENDPFSLFFITMNSHNPFLSPEISKGGWKTLNKDPEINVQKSVFLKNPDIKDYGKSINYQLEYLTDFILQNGGNDIFLLIGDHQPPVIAKTRDGFETPVHIISGDSTFVDGFNTYGFNSGLQIANLDTSIRHEGIYSIFLREFISNYALDSDNLPAYLPEGINIKKK